MEQGLGFDLRISGLLLAERLTERDLRARLQDLGIYVDIIEHRPHIETRRDRLNRIAQERMEHVLEEQADRAATAHAYGIDGDGLLEDAR